MPRTRSKSKSKPPHPTIDGSTDNVAMGVQGSNNDEITLSNSVINEIPHGIGADVRLSHQNEISSLPHSNEWDDLTNTPEEQDTNTHNPTIVSTTNLRIVLEGRIYQKENIEEMVPVHKFIFPENALILPCPNNSYAKLREPKAGYSYTSDNIKLYGKIVDRSEATNYYYSSDKKAFVIDFINTKLNNYVVYEFNDVHNKYMIMDNMKLNEAVKKRLNTLKGKVISKVKKGLCISPFTSSKTTLVSSSGNKRTSDNTSLVLHENKQEYLPFQMTDKNKVAKDLQQFYKFLYRNVKLLEGYDKWNYFSMFHSVYQSFSTVLYNSSHKLSDKSKVHRCSRVKLNFPENANCSLIIHGRLVHSGAESKTESKMSFNTSHDARLHAYLSNLSRSVSNTIYEQHLEPDTVDTGTFQLCTLDCLLCKERRELIKEDHLEYEVINIQDYLDAHHCEIKRQRTTYVQPKTHKLLGDLDELGWEVWTGLDTSLIKYTDLQSHLKSFVNGAGKSSWKGIGSTKRRVLKIDRLLGEETSNLHESLMYMTKVFDDINEHVLQHIPQLGTNIQMGPRAILSNFGVLDEQTPHRDFSSKKR